MARHQRGASGAKSNGGPPGEADDASSGNSVNPRRVIAAFKKLVNQGALPPGKVRLLDEEE